MITKGRSRLRACVDVTVIGFWLVVFAITAFGAWLLARWFWSLFTVSPR